MPTQQEPNSSPFPQIAQEASEALNVLTKGLEQENQVFLSFCDSLINQTLHAMTQLSKLDVNVAKAGAENARKELAKATEAANESAKAKAKEAAIPEKNANASKQAASQANSSEDLAHAFIRSVNNSMSNAVTSQQQMNITAQAATTQLIATIISVTTATLGVTISHIEGN